MALMRVLVANHSTHPLPEASEASAALAVEEQRAIGVDLPVVPPPRGAMSLSWLATGSRWLTLGPTEVTLPDGVRMPCPIVRGPMSGLPAAVCDLMENPPPGPWKLSLPGPYTLAAVSRTENVRYENTRALARAYRDLVIEIATALRATGAVMLQIEEPLLPHCPEELPFVRRLLEPLAEAAAPMRLSVAVTGKPAAPLYAGLQSLPIHVLALDVRADEELVETIATTGSSQVLALGVVNGRNGSRNDVGSTTTLVRRLLHRYALDEVLLQPATGLSGLDAATARSLLELLVATRDLLEPRRP